MSMSVESAEKILRAGSNLRVRGYGVESAVRLAKVARAVGVHLTLVGNYSIESNLEIAHAGGKNVTIDNGEE